MMTKLRACIATSFILFWCTISTSLAIELSLNQERFVPGDNLVLMLNENWSDEADVYIAVTLPADDVLLFLMPPQNFLPDFVPYAQGVSASGSREVLQMPLPVGLPVGEYTFYATAMRSIFDRIGDVAQTSFVYATEAELVELVLGDIRFPDGVIERRYSLAVEPESGMPPYQFSLSAGTLPVGLTLDKSSGLIQGEPSVRGFAEFTVQVVDGNGNIGEQPGAIKVYGVLTFGEYGTFKGCNGLQMAFNAVQDLDEIRIEQGTYDCIGVELAENKEITHGIKFSGGWDAEFKQQTIEPTLTVFDAGNQWIASADTEELCQDANGKWHSELERCSQNTLIDGRFFTLNNSGPIAVENFSFKNAYSTGNGGAISGRSNVTIDQCIFSGNSVFSSEQDVYGGAVHKVSHISNSTFSNNSASSFSSRYAYAYAYGGAISFAGDINNSTFNNNSVSSSYFSSSSRSYAYGGAIFDARDINNSTFSNNSVSSYSSYFSSSSYGGAISDANDISNSTFNNNWVFSGDIANGGAISNVGDISNSTFNNNSVSSSDEGSAHGGAIQKANTIISSNFNANIAKTGGAVNGISQISHSVFTKNTANKGGGAVSDAKYIINSLFADNTAVTGGAISSNDLTLINATIVNNSSSERGGGFYGTGKVLNSIFHQNTAVSEANDITPYFDGSLNLDYNLVNNLTGTYDYGTHNIMGEPRFVDAENSNFRLLPSSPALNVGDFSIVNACSEYDNCDSSCTKQCSDSSSEECKKSCCSCKQYTHPFLRDDNGNALDLEGNPRIVGGTIDMGAYELQ
jgi:predicted outer membrane repeat protein